MAHVAEVHLDTYHRFKGLAAQRAAAYLHLLHHFPVPEQPLGG